MSFRSGPRVVATDFDGTLTEAGPPDLDVLVALARLRGDGVRTVLVTGRILAELEDVFPDVAEHFDAIVAENGAVIATTESVHCAAPPVDRALLARLSNLGIPARQGRVIVACAGNDQHAVLDAIDDLGLECQLVHNRAELMILPSGVSKGTGLAYALARLGYSAHDTLAVGDAENDHSLLLAAELGVAVSNAVPALRERADLVLDEPAGRGFVSLVDRLGADGGLWATRGRHHLWLGHDVNGDPVQLLARPSNILIASDTGQGKSFVAGLLAEQLIDLDYSVLVIDPEGDHGGLGVLRSAVVVGGDVPPPPVEVVVSLMERSTTSVVIDLSSLDPAQRHDYLRNLPAEIEAARRDRGRPHWVFVDEAHGAVPRQEATVGSFEPAAKGYCLVTWRPHELPSEVLAALDVVMAMTNPEPDDRLIDLLAAVCGQPKVVVAEALTGPPGRVVVGTRGSQGPPPVAALGARTTLHFRHDHKYGTRGIPEQRRFVFRALPDHLTGAVARNLTEFEAELAHCDRAVLRHHAPHHDFSRWVVDVLHDEPLGDALRPIEASMTATSPAAAVEAARLALVTALRHRQRT